MIEPNKYFSELSRLLRKEGYVVSQEKEKRLQVGYDGEPVCEIGRDGTVHYGDVNNDSALANKILKVFKCSSSVNEYLRAYDEAPPLGLDGLQNYKKLIDYNGYCLAATDTKFGMQFVVWAWSHKHNAVTLGHYYSDSYEAAKEDFAERSRLIRSEKLFEQAELKYLHRCVDYYIANADEAGLDFEEIEKLEDLRERLVFLVPELQHAEQEQGQQMN